MCGLTPQKVEAAKLLQGDNRASGARGGEFIRVPPFVPSPGADKEAASGGRFSLSPLLPLPSPPVPPSPPPPSPHLPPRSRTSEALAAQSPSPGHSTRPSPPSTSLQLSPEMPGLVPSITPPSQRAHICGGEISKIIVSGRCASLFTLSLPITVNNPLWHRVSVSF